MANDTEPVPWRGWTVRVTGGTETAGWIVRSRIDDRDVAAGPSLGEAMRTARAIGADRGHVRPATAAELDSLDLPPTALGIAPGAAPWWRA